VRAYDGDLEGYRRMLLGQEGPAPAKGKPARPAAKSARAPAADLKELRAEVRKCEARMEKLAEMREELARRLGDPEVYADDMADRRRAWQAKYAEVEAAIEKAEALWLRAAERLEAAEAAA